MLVGLVLLVSALLAAQTVTDKTDINPARNRSWPAGPFAQVSTCFGVLQAAVPLFSLDGPGRTSIGLSVHNTMNQTLDSAPIATNGAGRGWRVSCSEYVNAGAQQGTVIDPFQSKAGNAAASWRLIGVNSSGIPLGYVRRPGTRSDLAEIRSGNTLLGYSVTEQADGTVWEYRHQGTVAGIISRWYLTSVRDLRGNTVTYSYAASGDRVSRITDAAGRYADLFWGAGEFGQLQRVVLTTSAGSRQWDFNYFTNSYNVGNILGRIDFPSPDGGPRPNVGFGYDQYQKITDVQDFRGSLWHYGYGFINNTNNTMIAVKAVHEPYEPNPGVVTGQYETTTPTRFDWTNDSANYQWKCAITDRAGAVWQHVYQNGVPASSPNAPYAEWMPFPIVKVQDPPYSGATAGTLNKWETFEWNYADATLARHVDREGNATETLYETVWPNCGLAYQEKRYLNGVPKVWQYLNWKPTGFQPRRVRSFDPDGRRSVVGMDWTHDEVIYTEVDPVNDPYAQALGQTSSFPGALGLRTNLAYNAQGELAETWMGNDPHAVNSSFDLYGNAQTVTDPAGNSTLLAYDAWGNKTSQSGPSPLGTTAFVYDGWDRLIETTLPGGRTVGAAYDANGNAVAARKEDGTLVATVFDSWNRPLSVSQPTGTTTLVTKFGYSLRGDRISVTNARNYTTYYDPDARGKTWRVRYPGGRTLQYDFDGNGRTVRTVNGRGQATGLLYDAFGRLTKIDYPSSFDVLYEYRIDGPRTKMTDGTGISTYAYDSAGRLTSATQGLTGKTLATTYVAGTNRRWKYGDGSQTWTYNYDAGLRLGSINQTVGSGVPVSYTYKPSGAVDVRTFANGTKSTYGYDARGRTIAIAHATTGGAAQATLGYGYGPDGNLQTYTDAWAGATPWTTTYAHDKADRLTSEVRTGGGSGNYSRAYAYDANGNRTSVTWDGVTYPYSAAGADDRFDSGFGRQMLNYDGDGNPGTYNDNGYLKYFQYDEMGRVTSISGSGASSFRYDGDGRRVERVAGGTTTRFVYDGDQTVLETNGSNATTLYRTPGVGWVRNGAQRYEFESALGSSLIVRDQSGATTGRTEYEAFGNESYQDNLGDRGEYRFAGGKGYQNDDATGMQLLGARYYLPILGRFLTQDPIGHEGGLNLYAYCDNSPLLRVDPDGTQMRRIGRLIGKPQQLMYEHIAGMEAAGTLPLGSAEAMLNGQLFSMLSASQKAGIGIAVVRRALLNEGVKDVMKEIAIDFVVDGVTTQIRADLGWFDRNGNFRIAEVKTGPRAGYTPNQRKVLPRLLEINGGAKGVMRAKGFKGRVINVILDRITRVKM